MFHHHMNDYFKQLFPFPRKSSQILAMQSNRMYFRYHLHILQSRIHFANNCFPMLLDFTKLHFFRDFLECYPRLLLQCHLREYFWLYKVHFHIILLTPYPLYILIKI